MNIKAIALAMLPVLSACMPPVSPPDPRLVNSPPAQVPKVPDNMPVEEKFQKLYSNVTHRIPYRYVDKYTPPIADPQTRYFAPNGKAWFLLENENRVVTGEWRVDSWGDELLICAAPGYVPKKFDVGFYQKNCSHVVTYAERATYFRAGDPLELQKQK